MVELLPCPFCGANASLQQVQTENHLFWADGVWYIEVNHQDWCPLYSMSFTHFGGEYNEQTGIYSPPTEEALKECNAWNTRITKERGGEK